MNTIYIEKGEIVIRVPIHALPDAAAVAFDRHYGFDNHRLAVVNRYAFAAELLERLLMEDELGNTLVTEMLDRACVEVEQAGAEGIAR